MLKAVFDTNIFISAFGVPKSKAETAYQLATKGKIIPYTSPAILTETASKLRSKFGISENQKRPVFFNIGLFVIHHTRAKF